VETSKSQRIATRGLAAAFAITLGLMSPMQNAAATTTKQYASVKAIVAKYNKVKGLNCLHPLIPAVPKGGYAQAMCDDGALIAYFTSASQMRPYLLNVKAVQTAGTGLLVGDTWFATHSNPSKWNPLAKKALGGTIVISNRP
jgi:hypothetical protein